MKISTDTSAQIVFEPWIEAFTIAVLLRGIELHLERHRVLRHERALKKVALAVYLWHGPA
jgi:hypothetical protein